MATRRELRPDANPALIESQTLCSYKADCCSARSAATRPNAHRGRCRAGTRASRKSGPRTLASRSVRLSRLTSVMLSRQGPERCLRCREWKTPRQPGQRSARTRRTASLDHVRSTLGCATPSGPGAETVIRVRLSSRRAACHALDHNQGCATLVEERNRGGRCRTSATLTRLPSRIQSSGRSWSGPERTARRARRARRSACITRR